jgi:hypothetical protein
MSRLLHLPLLLLLLPVLAPAFLLPAPRVALPTRQQLQSTVEGADYPSDTADPDLSLDASASTGGNGTSPPPIADEAKSTLRENFKCKIYKGAAKLNRGQLANLDEKVGGRRKEVLGRRKEIRYNMSGVFTHPLRLPSLPPLHFLHPSERNDQRGRTTRGPWARTIRGC